MNKLDYQIINKKCKNALIDLPFHDDTSMWLKENKALYNSINIQPAGRPGIANSNYEGIWYEHISKFHSKYCSFENDSK
jgi:hypothetical protein